MRRPIYYLCVDGGCMGILGAVSWFGEVIILTLVRMK